MWARWPYASAPGSRFKPWPGKFSCFLGQETWLSQCLSPPRSKNGCGRIVGETWTSIPSRGSRNTSSRFVSVAWIHATEPSRSSGSHEPVVAPRLHVHVKKGQSPSYADLKTQKYIKIYQFPQNILRMFLTAHLNAIQVLYQRNNPISMPQTRLYDNGSSLTWENWHKDLRLNLEDFLKSPMGHSHYMTCALPPSRDTLQWLVITDCWRNWNRFEWILFIASEVFRYLLSNLKQNYLSGTCHLKKRLIK